MLGTYSGVKLRDKRWLSGGRVEPMTQALQQQKEEEDEEFYDALEKFDDLYKCTTCNIALEIEDRDLVVAHYRSDWHRYNARQVIRGKQPLKEEEFEELNDENQEASASNSSSSEGEDENVNALRFPLQNSRVFFSQDRKVFSIYRCLLNDLEFEVSPQLLTRPLDCTILLLNGGHFAGGIFENDRFIEHRTFHRYVARAKQGGVQSQHDKTSGKAHSGGANLRRYNERALVDDIKALLEEWEKPITRSPLIFLRCANYQRGVFLGEDSPIERKDTRIRSIPFESRRPTLDEVKRVWERLSRVFEHGSQEEFLSKLQEHRESMKKTRILQKKAKERERLRTLTDSEEERDVTGEREIKQKKKDHLKSREVRHEEEPDQWPLLEADWRKKLYAAARANNVEEVRRLVAEKQNPNGEENQALLYLRQRRYPPDDSTLLHIVTHKGLDSLVEYLLEEADCDPSLKNAEDKPPYAMSSDKTVRALFVAFRQRNPHKHNWAKCHIPAPVVKTEEQKLKEKEKKKEKKAKAKEKLVERREVEKKEEEERKAKEAYLALSDREKRALAAERRIAGLSAIASDGQGAKRCMQCGALISGAPFEYSGYQFCKPACVAQHRAKNQPQKS